MIVRVVYRADGGVSVIYPVLQSRLKDETEEQWLDRVFTRAMEKQDKLRGQPYDDIDSLQLPSREDRNAWEGKKGEGVKVNLVKAKELKDVKEKEAKILKEMRVLAEQSLKDKGDL